MTTRAPKDFSRRIFSAATLSVMVKIAREPLIAQTIASATPVFADVPRLPFHPVDPPLALGLLDDRAAERSLRLPPGFRVSSLGVSARRDAAGEALRRTIGVETDVSRWSRRRGARSRPSRDGATVGRPFSSYVSFHAAKTFSAISAGAHRLEARSSSPQRIRSASKIEI